jgi:hypothetical protein
LLLLTADLEGAATALEARKVVRPTSIEKSSEKNEKSFLAKVKSSIGYFWIFYLPIAGAKAETELVASAIAAKAPMMEEKRNIFQVIN